MTSPTGVDIIMSLSGTNPLIGIVTDPLSPYQILLCTYIYILQMFL